MIGFMDIIEIRKYEDDVTDEMLLILEKVADELKLARDKVFDDCCQEYGTANILKQCDHLSADINEYLNLRKIIFAMNIYFANHLKMGKSSIRLQMTN